MPTPERASLEQIVSAATRLVESDGLDGMTMSAVAARVGVRPPSLYKRVKDRDDLVGMVIEAAARELRARLDAALADAGADALARVRAIVVALRAFAHERPVVFGLLIAPVPAAVRASADTLAMASDALITAVRAVAGPERALDAARTVTAWSFGFITMELTGAFQLGGDIDSAFAFGLDRVVNALKTGYR